MKPLFGYFFLAIGILFGIVANSLAKISDGFTKLTPSVLCILFMCITMFSIAKAMSALPVGFAYSTYSGLTVTGVVLFAVLKFIHSRTIANAPTSSIFMASRINFFSSFSFRP